MRDFKVSLVQFAAILGDAEANFGMMKAWIDQALSNGSELLCLPEMCLSGHVEDDIEIAQQMAEIIPDGLWTAKLIEIARKNSIYLSFGLVEKEGDRLYNTQVLCGPEGFVGKQRKIHNGEAQDDGCECPVFETDLGKIGIAICYDNQFAEQIRLLAKQGMEILLMPHAAVWHEPYSDDPNAQAKVVEFNRTVNYNRVFKARCYENAVFGLYCNQVGLSPNPAGEATVHHCGGLAIFDPFGQVYAEGESRLYQEEILHSEVRKDIFDSYQPSQILNDEREFKPAGKA